MKSRPWTFVASNTEEKFTYLWFYGFLILFFVWFSTQWAKNLETFAFSGFPMSKGTAMWREVQIILGYGAQIGGPVICAVPSLPLSSQFCLMLG